MQIIRCNTWELRDFETTIDYAKEQRRKECEEGKITELELKLDLEKFNRLKQRVSGKYKEDYLQNSWKNPDRSVRKKDDLPTYESSL